MHDLSLPDPIVGQIAHTDRIRLLLKRLLVPFAVPTELGLVRLTLSPLLNHLETWLGAYQISGLLEMFLKAFRLISFGWAFQLWQQLCRLLLDLGLWLWLPLSDLFHLSLFWLGGFYG